VLKRTSGTEPHRPLILTSLSLFYQDQIPRDETECLEELRHAFQVAAFGTHGTEAEVKAWLDAEQYLNVQLQPSQSACHNLKWLIITLMLSIGEDVTRW
jgi:hypothetical protein